MEDDSDYENPSWFDGYEYEITRLSLERNSSLYAQLCGVEDGRCVFSSEVVLSENLPCAGMECLVDTARVVQLTSNTTNSTVYYEYVRVPCVEFGFYANPRQVKERDLQNVQCANPLTTSAMAGCCRTNNFKFDGACEYYGERVTYETGRARCEARGLNFCEFVTGSSMTECETSSSRNFRHIWTNVACVLHVQVRGEDAVQMHHCQRSHPAPCSRWNRAASSLSCTMSLPPLPMKRHYT